MRVDQALIDACYRSLVSKDFHIDQGGISFATRAKDMALICGAGKKEIKEALKLALERKTAEDVKEIYGEEVRRRNRQDQSWVDEMMEDRDDKR